MNVWSRIIREYCCLFDAVEILSLIGCLLFDSKSIHAYIKFENDRQKSLIKVTKLYQTLYAVRNIDKVGYLYSTRF